jgi:hypothetical protein
VVTSQSGRAAPPVIGATGESSSIAARSATIRSVGAQPNARRRRWLTTACQRRSR